MKNTIIHTARDLQPGQLITLDFGAMYGTARAVVLGHVEGRFGHHAEVTIERRDPETGAISFCRDTVTGTPSPYIGWRP